MKKNMNNNKRLFKILAIFLISFVCVSILVIYNSLNEYKSDTSIFKTDSLELIPINIGSEGISFLEDEAGISAYTNVGVTIQLSSVKNVFRTIETETSDYIIGSVPISEYDEEYDVHCYVDTDGWIVTYYLKEDPSAKIVDWEFYTEGEQITSTILSRGINEICIPLGLLPGVINYYHFGYPYANKFMIVVEALWDEGVDSFDIKLPSDLVYYERSYSHCSKGNTGSSMNINGDYFGTTSAGETNYDFLSSSEIPVDTLNNIELRASSSWGTATPAFCSIVLVYKEV